MLKSDLFLTFSMKKYLAIICIILGSVGISVAYNPTETDTQQLNKIKWVLNTVSSNDLWNYYQQFAKLQKAVFTQDDKLNYLLTNLRDYSYSQFSILKNLAKQQSKAEKTDFFNTYKNNIILDQDVYNNCLGWYNTIDNISFANNFPTALTLAVWYRESTCSYALPKNGDGPFQIISKDYGTGDITEELFVKTVEDFIEFAQNKIKRYNDRNASNDLSIDLSYTGASYTDLLRFAALYNGLSWGTVYGEISPAAPKYFFEGYQTDQRSGESKKFWIFPKYLKLIERELNN